MNAVTKKITASLYVGSLIYLLGFSNYKNTSHKIFMYFDALWQLTTPILTFKITSGILVLLLLFFIFALKGNIICRLLCPWGRIIAFLPGNRTRKINVNPSRYIFYLMMIMFILKINTLMFFDPFVFFVQICAFLNMGLSFIFIIPASISLLLNIFKKQLWCQNICPLGFILNTSAKHAQKIKKPLPKKTSPINIPRRQFIIGSAAFITAISTRNILAKTLTVKNSVLRPPSACNETSFRKKCIRCGACISICPTNALQPTFTNGFMTPILKPKTGYCSEFCNACTNICPTGAIVPVSLAKKRSLVIGKASINKNTCLCFKDKKLCLLCVESCPYHAIEAVTINNIRVPIVNTEICIGCGKCENKCPINPIGAIAVFKQQSI